MRNKILHKYDYYSCCMVAVFSPYKVDQSWCQNFFFNSEFLNLVLFQRPTSSKNGRSFHGEVVTFISVIDGIRGTVHNATLFLAVQIYIYFCSNVIVTIQMRQLTEITRDISKSLEFWYMI
jgi:hypothetical protein